MTCSSIGETSSNAWVEPTRSPPIQWSVEISTPSIAAVAPVERLLPAGIGPERRAVPLAVSNGVAR
jgi:hypothetical protein